LKALTIEKKHIVYIIIFLFIYTGYQQTSPSCNEVWRSLDCV